MSQVMWQRPTICDRCLCSTGKENSAAEQAGIQKGDIITAFDGKDVSSMEDLSSKLQYYKAGTTVDVTIQRSSNGRMKSRRSLSHWERRTDRKGLTQRQ